MPRPELALEHAAADLFGKCELKDAVRELSKAGGEARGAIFTRREVVDFILDLIGYEPGTDLTTRRLLEPSFGEGDFLLPVIDRLLTAWKAHAPARPARALAGCIRAVELHEETFTATRDKVIARLRDAGIAAKEAKALAGAWLIFGDFLLAPLEGVFDYVAGNPPYLRQELIPAPLIAEYRSRYATIFDRADIYIPFFERSLFKLGKGGRLGFICSDRWMKNRYGAPLRSLVSTRFRLAAYVDMVDTQAFHSDVVAYPAITIIEAQPGGATRIAERPSLEPGSLRTLAAGLRGETPHAGVTSLSGIASGREPWVFNTTPELALVRRLERDFPLIEETGCRIGIGVATGADKAFIGQYETLDVEPDRKLPLAMTRDIRSGEVEWRGYGVINPFAEDGKLVDLGHYPKLAAYLDAHYDQIAGRHVAKKAPSRWYRTIDRIYPDLARQPKLLIPDIKGDAQVVYEAGELYPHHNLYYVTAETWNLRALQAVLASSITRLFITTYSTRMRGGYLRFQAQYLRRLRLPAWHTVPPALRTRLSAAGAAGSVPACNAASFDLYGLSPAERALFGDEGLCDAA